jgi:hypothetical protein
MVNNTLSKKIGIVTQWELKDNYGSILQCYALQYALRKVGYEPFLIKYHKRHKKTDTLKYWLFALLFCRLKRIVSTVKRKIKERRKPEEIIDRGFDDFIKQHIHSTEKIYSQQDLLEYPPQADFYICGSDNVWMEYDKVYFLDWGDANIPRIAYACSFGNEDITPYYKGKLKKSLQKFKVVTVREKSGADICIKSGREDTFVVPDPTMLLDQEDYKKLIIEEWKKNYKYLFLYLLSEKTEVEWDIILAFAKQNNLKIICVQANGKYRNIPQEINTVFPTVEGWLSLMLNAEYVLTNSFHGTVFSIIFNKQFLVIPQIVYIKHTKPNNRALFLLNKFNIIERVFNNDIEQIKVKIDYDKVNEILNEDRDRMRKYFKTWFSI